MESSPYFVRSCCSYLTDKTDLNNTRLRRDNVYLPFRTVKLINMDSEITTDADFKDDETFSMPVLTYYRIEILLVRAIQTFNCAL